MARYAGKIGFAETVKTKPGVAEDVIHERIAYGEVLRPSRNAPEGPKVNNDFTVGVSVSIVIDPEAAFWAIKYAWWKGHRWAVTKVAPGDGPRLVLELGEMYHGPTPEAAGTP